MQNDTVEIKEIYFHTFEQKFRENDAFTNNLIWRNIFSVRVFFSFFHIAVHCVSGISLIFSSLADKAS